MLIDDRVLRLLWDRCEVGCCTVSAEGRFVAVNDKLCDILEYSPAELVGKHFREVTAPSDAAAALEMADRLLRGEVEHYRMVETCIKKSGFPVLIDLVVHPVKHADGSFDFFMSQIVPRVDVRTNDKSTVTVEPALILGRLLLDNKKLVSVSLATLGAVATALAVLFEVVKGLLDSN